MLILSSSNDQGVTTTVTFSTVISAPSCAIHRRTYSPGALKVARVSHLLSAGIGGVFQPTAHGEFAPLRVSCHAVNCGGSNVTSPAPRYFIHTSRSPVAESGTVRLPPSISWSGRGGQPCQYGGSWPKRSRSRYGSTPQAPVARVFDSSLLVGRDLLEILERRCPLVLDVHLFLAKAVFQAEGRPIKQCDCGPAA